MMSGSAALGFTFLCVFIVAPGLGAIYSFFFARRKNANPWVFCLLGLLPFFGVFTTFWLSTRTDKVVLDRLDALEKMVGEKALGEDAAGAKL
jgi:hypothetical protein